MKRVSCEPPADQNGRFCTDNLPPQCVEETLQVFRKPIHKALTDANRQIKETKAYFNTPNARGLLILANDGNFSLNPNLSVHIIARLLSSHFSAIESFIYFAPNLRTYMPGVDKETRVWISGASREGNEGVPPSLLDEVFRGWIGYVQGLSGAEIELIEITDASRVQSMHFIRKGTP